jgi:hypothetical protein
VSPQVIRSRTHMRHDGGNMLKFQEDRDKVTAVPLNPLECGIFKRLKSQVSPLDHP